MEGGWSDQTLREWGKKKRITSVIFNILASHIKEKWVLQIRHVLGIPKTTPYRDTIHVYVPNDNGFMLPKVLFHTLCHHFKKNGHTFFGSRRGWLGERGEI